MVIIQDEQRQLKSLRRQLLLNKLFVIAAIEGKKDFIDFLELTWDLKKMPSTDSRFNNARGDICQHMINNPEDWGVGYDSYHYLFGSYLGLYDGTDTQFFRFLETIVHPLVREGEELQKYVSAINDYLSKDGLKLEIREEIEGYLIYRIVKLNDGVKGKVKNLIFAANGPKPELFLIDAVNNDIQIDKNEKFCLVYDLPIPSTGLLWLDLVNWWADLKSISPNKEAEKSLYLRLKESLQSSEPEQLLFDSYFRYFHDLLQEKLPALIPQVYLHYDFYTKKQLKDKTRLQRQRMDFLLLFSNSERIVIEVDGKHHYADGIFELTPQIIEKLKKDRTSNELLKSIEGFTIEKTVGEEEFLSVIQRQVGGQEISTKSKQVILKHALVDHRVNAKKYAEMVMADRHLRISGYEIYRFGGYEFLKDKGKTIAKEFFESILKKHQVIS